MDDTAQQKLTTRTKFRNKKIESFTREGWDPIWMDSNKVQKPEFQRNNTTLLIQMAPESIAR